MGSHRVPIRVKPFGGKHTAEQSVLGPKKFDFESPAALVRRVYATIFRYFARHLGEGQPQNQRHRFSGVGAMKMLQAGQSANRMFLKISGLVLKQPRPKRAAAA